MKKRKTHIITFSSEENNSETVNESYVVSKKLWDRLMNEVDNQTLRK